jgi:HEAT repeat protein
MQAPLDRGLAALAALLLSVWGLAALSCGGASASVKAAEQGDLAALRTAIASERASGRLDRSAVRKLAKRTGERELTRSSPEATLVRIDEARGCARPLSSALESLTKTPGDVGASATLALLEQWAAAEDGERLLRLHGASPNPLWRAVAARTAIGEELGPARRTFYTDADERVRLAALRAALDKKDQADRRSLLEAARLDPNPLARSLALRALGGVADGDAVLALRDLYSRSDESLRQSIVDAWGQSDAAASGGIRELVRVAENERGSPSIEAGWLLLRFTREPDAPAVGSRALIRAIGDGITRDRVLAIADAPIADPGVVEALRKAAAVQDPAVKTAALSRLLESRATRDESLRALDSLAKSGSKEALYALARAGDRPAAREVVKDLAAQDPETRLAAGRTLVAAGDFAAAADLLADADAHVRMSAACSILGWRDD